MERKINIESLRPTWKVRRLLSGRLRVTHPNDHELKSFFQSRNITHTALAKELGFSVGSVLAWLNGVREPNPTAEIMLRQVQEKILKWEQEHGQRFGL